MLLPVHAGSGDSVDRIRASGQRLLRERHEHARQSEERQHESHDSFSCRTPGSRWRMYMPVCRPTHAPASRSTDKGDPGSNCSNSFPSRGTVLRRRRNLTTHRFGRSSCDTSGTSRCMVRGRPDATPRPEPNASVQRRRPRRARRRGLGRDDFDRRAHPPTRRVRVSESCTCIHPQALCRSVRCTERGVKRRRPWPQRADTLGLIGLLATNRAGGGWCSRPSGA